MEPDRRLPVATDRNVRLRFTVYVQKLGGWQDGLFHHKKLRRDGGKRN
jgi:hypothetical protein